MVWGIVLKSWSKWSLRFKLLTLSTLITIICVVAGGFITRELTERERKLQFNMGPHEHNYSVMNKLLSSGKFTALEAFAIVELDKSQRSPHRSYLLDHKDVVVAKNTNRGFGDDEPDFSKVEKLKLGPDYFIVYQRPSGPPPGGFHGGGPRHGPPPGMQFIGLVAIAVSIIVGLALSILFLTIFVRKKSSQAEEVIARLKAGDLKARFKVGDTDEVNQLMMRFNDMADQIENLVSNLRNTEKARMIMLQELAHDLRTPVASLKQFQEILLFKGHLLDEEKKKQTQLLAMKEIHYFERLVEDLLFLSGVNDPKYSASFRAVDLNDLISEEIEAFENEKIAITKISTGAEIVQGDAHLLKRLLKNALSNALKHATSKIEVVLSENENDIVIEVKDDGPGMKESDLAIFGEKKFSRQVDSNISIGLGSVIMKKIISLHDGSLNVQNQSIGGLHVIIKIPHG
jgi:signal transduction histidine kinase